MRRDETLRRIRLGDLQRLLRDRYGNELPDDDAGRADLHELLLTISLGDGADRKMANACELLAPWMAAAERQHVFDDINRTPDYLRKITAAQMGEKMNLQNRQRERLAIRTIAPVDMTPKQLKEQRKAKKRAREERRRRAEGKKPRELYLANSLSRTKPWEVEGVSKRTWYRNQNRVRGTGQRQIKLTNAERSLVPRSRGRVSKRTSETVRTKGEGRTIRRRILANDLRARLVSNG